MTGIGSRIRDIRLVERLGEGGMGEVFVGVHERLGREVAVKALRQERCLDDASRTRFRREARILSRLEHPNICRLYDLIEEEDSEYIVLELLRGKTLREELDAGMDDDARIRVAEQVAAALVAAHAMTVVHRDLKPENIMVGDDGLVKVLDFGLARREDHAPLPARGVDATGSPTCETVSDPDPSLVTRLGDVVGTPSYLSPEQARGDVVTAASDMYSFGLLLFELWTGRRPYGVDSGRSELVRKAAWGEIDPAEGVDPGVATLITQLTALDPAERPGAAVAAERLRHIRERPVRRAKRRALISVVLVLAIAAVASGIGFWRARIAQRDAEGARNEAEAVTQFLVSLFEVTDPEEGTGGDVTARELLERGASRVDSELADQPVIRATLMHTIGQVYQKLGLYTEAEALVENAFRLRETHLGTSHLDTAATLNLLGSTLLDLGQFDRAEALYRRALAIREHELGEEHPRVTAVLNNLAGVHFFRGDFEGAAQLMERTVAIQERTLGEDAPQFAESLGNLAVLYRRLGRLDEAELLLRRSLAIQEKSRGHDNPALVYVLESLANVLSQRGEFEQAEALYRRAIGIVSEAVGPDSPMLASLLGNLGGLHAKSGRLSEAERAQRRALAILESSLDPDHPAIAATLQNLGYVCHELGRLEEAEASYRRSLAINEPKLPPSDPRLVRTRENLARLLRETGRAAEAEALAGRAAGES